MKIGLTEIKLIIIYVCIYLIICFIKDILTMITDFSIFWNNWRDPHWGYNYEKDADYEHEFCLYRLCFIWSTLKKFKVVLEKEDTKHKYILKAKNIDEIMNRYNRNDYDYISITEIK